MRSKVDALVLRRALLIPAQACSCGYDMSGAYQRCALCLEDEMNRRKALSNAGGMRGRSTPPKTAAPKGLDARERQEPFGPSKVDALVLVQRERDEWKEMYRNLDEGCRKQLAGLEARALRAERRLDELRALSLVEARCSVCGSDDIPLEVRCSACTSESSSPRPVFGNEPLPMPRSLAATERLNEQGQSAVASASGVAPKRPKRETMVVRYSEED